MRRLGFTHTLRLARPFGAALAATLAMACSNAPLRSPRRAAETTATPAGPPVARAAPPAGLADRS
jgi:hypothetical protein